MRLKSVLAKQSLVASTYRTSLDTSNREQNTIKFAILNE